MTTYIYNGQDNLCNFEEGDIVTKEEACPFVPKNSYYVRVSDGRRQIVSDFTMEEINGAS